MSTSQELIESECVRLDKKGHPFISENQAESFQAAEQLPPNVWGICRYNGGFAVAQWQWIVAEKKRAEEKAEAEALAKAAKPEEYRFIILSGASENDYQEVPVNVNGQYPGMLWLKRGVKLALPMSIINVLKDAKHGNYKRSSDPQVPCVRDGDVTLFPFSDLGPATKEDWEKSFNLGRKLREEAIVRAQTQEKG